MVQRRCDACRKLYSSRQHLYRHKKSCKGSDIPAPEISDCADSLHRTGSEDHQIDSSAISDKYVWKIKGVGKNHCFLFPRDIRGIIVGKSGFGKSTLLTHLLLESELLDYNTLNICGRSLDQPEYQIMNNAFSKNLSKKQVRTIFENQDEIEERGGVESLLESSDLQCKGGVDVTLYEDVAEILDPSAYDNSRKNLLIFDDIMLGPQNKAEAFFTRGRHNNIDVIYIAQSYFRLPRQTVRENANFFIFFRQDNKNLSHIYQDHCSIDEAVPFEKFKNFCTSVWDENKHNFVTIDPTRPWYCGKYRKNLNDYWIP